MGHGQSWFIETLNEHHFIFNHKVCGITGVSLTIELKVDFNPGRNYYGHNNSQGDLMDNIQKIIPVTKAKRELLDLIKEMSAEDSTIAVTKNGVPVGILMTPDRYDALLETIEILADPKILKALDASRKDFESDRIYTHQEVWKD